MGGYAPKKHWIFSRATGGHAPSFVIKKGVWHNLESLEPDSVIFECKEGPFVEHEEEGILMVEG